MFWELSSTWQVHSLAVLPSTTFSSSQPLQVFFRAGPVLRSWIRWRITLSDVWAALQVFLCLNTHTKIWCNYNRLTQHTMIWTFNPLTIWWYHRRKVILDSMRMSELVIRHAFFFFTVVKITPNQSESSILPVHEINNPTCYVAGRHLVQYTVICIMAGIGKSWILYLRVDAKQRTSICRHLHVSRISSRITQHGTEQQRLRWK